MIKLIIECNSHSYTIRTGVMGMRNSLSFADSVYETLTLHTTAIDSAVSAQSILDILDGSSIGSFTIDIGNWQNLVFSDKFARLLNIEGLSSNEQLQRIILAVHPEDRDRVRDHFHSMIKIGETNDSIEFRMIPDHNQTVWVLVRGKYIFENGQAVKYYASCFDITPRKEYEEELRRKNSLISDFFTNISHEFRTPLSIMLMDLDLMDIHLEKADCGHRDKITHNVAVLRQNTYRMFRLISNLLDVTAVNAGSMHCVRFTGDIVANTRSIVESATAYARKRGIALLFRNEMATLPITMDHEKYERVLMNLLSNAIKHTNPCGQVIVSLAYRHNHLTVCVADNGCGIPDDKKDSMFDMFRQVNTSLTRNNEGVGIGLALSKGLVELMGGKIWFTSKVGEGSTFYFRLPVFEPQTDIAQCGAERVPLDKRLDIEFSDLINM